VVDPIRAEGRALCLSRVVIEQGAKIPLHYHEGTQLGYIENGTLTYTVHTGEVKVATGPDDDGVAREITAGQTGEVGAGQWIVEQPSEQHRAANLGDEKIVIYLANLLKEKADPSTPADCDSYCFGPTAR
jgi:quercetin dioxygenase-like cupin family protein